MDFNFQTLAKFTILSIIVSIPDRDFSGFQPVVKEDVELFEVPTVSIPDRDFSGFQP